MASAGKVGWAAPCSELIKILWQGYAHLLQGVRCILLLRWEWNLHIPSAKLFLLRFEEREPQRGYLVAE